MGKTSSNSSSKEQTRAEDEIRKTLSKDLGVTLQKEERAGCELDGYAEKDQVTFLVEIYAHIGKLKPGHTKKIVTDMAKLLLVERNQQACCRKIVAVIDKQIANSLNTGKSWHAKFARSFNIEVMYVAVSDRTRKRILDAQKRQSKPRKQISAAHSRRSIR